MSFLGLLGKVVIGAPLGVLAVVALPVFGAVGSATALGTAVGAVVGATGAVLDELNED